MHLAVPESQFVHSWWFHWLRCCHNSVVVHVGAATRLVSRPMLASDARSVGVVAPAICSHGLARQRWFLGNCIQAQRWGPLTLITLCNKNFRAGSQSLREITRIASITRVYGGYCHGPTSPRAITPGFACQLTTVHVFLAHRHSGC